MELTGTSMLVVGGASGMGAATARLAAERGARVVVGDRDAERGGQVAAEIGGRFCPVDVTSESDVIAAVDAAAELAPLRALVVTAGIGRGRRVVGKDLEYSSAHSLELYEEVIRVNLVGSFNCARIAATAIARNDPVDEVGERGAMVFTSSQAGYGGGDGQTAYASSKGGLHALGVTLARDLGPLGIRVNVIAPGTFDTPIFDTLPRGDQVKADLAASRPFPSRLGDPREYATMAIELVANSFMNGAVVSVHGAERPS